MLIIITSHAQLRGREAAPNVRHMMCAQTFLCPNMCAHAQDMYSIAHQMLYVLPKYVVFYVYVDVYFDVY